MASDTAIPGKHSNSINWTSEDTISLLSWLEHTLRHDELDFDTTVFAYLGGKYTPEQVELKLSRLWTDHGPRDKYPATWQKDLVRFGVSCLYGRSNGIGLVEKGAIGEAVQKLEEDIAKQLQLASRRLRRVSKSEQIKVPSTEKCNLGTAGTRPPLIIYEPFKKSNPAQPSSLLVGKRARTRIDKSSPLQRKKNKTRPDLVHKRDYTTGLHRSSSTPDCPIFPAGVERAIISDRLRSLNFVKDTDTDLSDAIHEDDILRSASAVYNKRSSRESGKSFKRASASRAPRRLGIGGEILEKKHCTCGQPETDEQGVSFDWITCEKCEVWDHACCINDNSVYICAQCATGYNRYRTEIQADNSQLGDPSQHSDDRLTSALSEIDYLKDKLRSAEESLEECTTRVEDLERQVSHLQQAQKLRDHKSGRPIEQIMVGYAEKLETLESELRNRQKFGTFTRLTSFSREWNGKTKVDDGFRQVTQYAQDIMCRFESSALPFKPLLKEHPELSLLFSAYMELGYEGFESEDFVAELLNMNAQALIRALITSALRQWVFEAEYLRFEESSPVLDNYRQILFHQDGPKALKNLDLAALSVHVNSRAFRDRDIPRDATKLAVRLSQVLVPLFSPSPQAPEETDYDGFATWRENYLIRDEQRHRFIEMFKAALITKADSYLNTEEYEMLIFPPGTIYDKGTMVVETADGIRDLSGNHKGRVQLCVEAAVYAYPKRIFDEDGSVDDVVVIRKNFVRKSGWERDGLRPLVKAVVVLQSGED